MNPLLKTFLISMVPVIELRGAIPIALASGANLIPAVAVAMLGNLLPIPFILLFIRKILEWMNGCGGFPQRVARWVEKHAAKRSATVQKYVFWGLVLFVGVPLPGTGAWTGALIAALLRLPWKRAFLAIALGVLIAGILVSLASLGILHTFAGG